MLGLGGLHRCFPHDLAHLAGLLGERTHLIRHIFAVQPDHLGQILGVQQRLRVVQRGLHILLGKGDRLGAAQVVDPAGGR